MRPVEGHGGGRFPVKPIDQPNSKIGCDRGNKARTTPDAALRRACTTVNRHAAVRAVERDWDALTDEIVEPWDEDAVNRGGFA